MSDTPTLFDHLNHIYSQQTSDYWESLSDAGRKSFTTYMINRFISMNKNHVQLVNDSQLYGLLSPREAYLFFINVLPKKKQFNKYIKSSKTKDEWDEWLTSLIAKHFSVSLSEANEYLNIFYSTGSGKNELRKICEGYGIEAKKLKKAKL